MQSQALASYAVTADNSRGRQYACSPARDRTAFQRDYSRLVNCRAFRRLQGKTQVFSSNRGDLYRTRITHSLEVDQLARSLCRMMGLNEDLAGALAVGHDIGHAPFGHMGQDVLDELAHDAGGFEHNYQALRIVDHLESPYFDHPGLNLMFETREGLLKHCTPERALRLGVVAQRHRDRQSPTLEAQVVDWADAMAYCHADLEDALVMRVLDVETLRGAPGYAHAWSKVLERFPVSSHPTTQDLDAPDPVHARKSLALVMTAIRHMLSTAMEDLLAASRVRIERVNPQSLEDVRNAPVLVGPSETMLARHQALKAFSREKIYSHPEVTRVRKLEHLGLRILFAVYRAHPEQMGGRGPMPDTDPLRAVADHISGMTDRYVLEEVARLAPSYPSLVGSVVDQMRERGLDDPSSVALLLSGSALTPSSSPDLRAAPAAAPVQSSASRRRFARR